MRSLFYVGPIATSPVALALAFVGAMCTASQVAAAQPKNLNTVPGSAIDLDGFIQQAEAWLLSGEDPPPELPRLLDALTPSDRLIAVVYLRRSGLLTGPAMDPARLLAPQEAPAS